MPSVPVIVAGKSPQVAAAVTNAAGIIPIAALVLAAEGTSHTSDINNAPMIVAWTVSVIFFFSFEVIEELSDSLIFVEHKRYLGYRYKRLS